MRRRSNKKKGTTLIEVLISIAIFSIVTIPLSMMVISSISNNKKGENKQYAVSSAQQIIELVRANNTAALTNITIKTDATHELDFTKLIDPSIGYLALDEDVGNGFKANVTFERKLSYESVSTTDDATKYDLSILMDINSITVSGTSAADITGDVSYNLTDDLKICNNHNNTIELKNNNTNVVLGTYKPKDSSKDNLIDNIKISYSPNYGPHEIHSENSATTPLSIYTFKEGNSKVNSYTNSKGSIILYECEPVDGNDNGIYEISVEIYKVVDSNKVKVYSTKTSVSIGT